MRVDLGCGQITWRGHPEEDALRDIVRAGYRGAPWNERLGDTPGRIAQAFGNHGLQPAPAYLGGDFWDPSRYDELVATARRYAEISRALGVGELYISTGGFETVTSAGRTRRQAAAHVHPGDQLSDAAFDQLARTTEAIGAATREYGVQACYHSHVGTFVETEDELERLLAATDPDLVLLGPDTGHLAWAGIDPVTFARRHPNRIRTMHLKDMDGDVRARGVAEDWDYAEFERHAIWTEVGQGSVDFPAILELLDSVCFDGWLIVETDVTQRESPYESARISREYLATLGI